MSTSSVASPDLSYPIGKFHYSGPMSREERTAAVATIEALPARMREAVHGLSAQQLQTPYRPGGWTVRQLVHHVGDSHINAYVRTKLALTEQEPTIKAYDQAAWATLADTQHSRLETSLNLLEAIHERWVHLLRNFSDADYARTLRHPEQGIVTLDRMVALYAWHGPHHVAHISELRKRNGW